WYSTAFNCVCRVVDHPYGTIRGQNYRCAVVVTLETRLQATNDGIWDFSNVGPVPLGSGIYTLGSLGSFMSIQYRASTKGYSDEFRRMISAFIGVEARVPIKLSGPLWLVRPSLATM